MYFVGVIPVRYASTRLRGKPLIEIAGKTLIQWVYERAIQASRLAEVIVATDDGRISEAVQNFGGRVVMTRGDHLSGTDRVAEVAEQIEGDVFVNIQGDEPLISPETIEAVCSPFEEDSTLGMTTARVEIRNPSEAQDPHIVKVVVDGEERAMYFSRSAIPYSQGLSATYFKHLGIYGFRRQVLLNLSRLKPSQLEGIEKLEQLRFLENGIPIWVVQVSEDSICIDTQEDLERVRPLLENASSSHSQKVEPRRKIKGV